MISRLKSHDNLQLKRSYCSGLAKPCQKVVQVARWSGHEDLRRRAGKHAHAAWRSAERYCRGRFRQTSSSFLTVFDFFRRMCRHEESLRTNPPARRWMSVSRSPITVAQEPSSRSLLNPSSLLLCHSIQSSVHPIPARARSVKSTALRSWSRESQVGRSRLGSEFDGGAARPARRTLPHTHTGQRAPQFYNPQSKLLRFVNLGFDSFAVDVFLSRLDIFRVYSI